MAISTGEKNAQVDPEAGNPVVRRVDGKWCPTPCAMGPFGGLHGGVVSGLLSSELEEMGIANGWGQPVSATAYLVRPAPLEDFETKTEIVREGARLTVVENSLIAGGKLRSKVSMAFLQDVPVPGMVPHIDEPSDPDALTGWDFQPVFTTQTYLSAVEVRDDRDARMVWVRPKQPLISTPTPFGQTIAIADYATLFVTYLDGERPKAGGWPNADISLHLSRLPEGEWIGVRPRSSWHPNGTGFTEAEIFDTRGWIGRSGQSVALLPLAEE
ncbi:MAG: thioesterase family protein [Candidatus Phaeomarinobacter sp.]